MIGGETCGSVNRESDQYESNELPCQRSVLSKCSCLLLKYIYLRYAMFSILNYVVQANFTKTKIYIIIFFKETYNV